MKITTTTTVTETWGHGERSLKQGLLYTSLVTRQQSLIKRDQMVYSV
jgi:hypothetical protein